jgi:hypothetical protein
VKSHTLVTKFLALAHTLHPAPNPRSVRLTSMIVFPAFSFGSMHLSVQARCRCWSIRSKHCGSYLRYCCCSRPKVRLRHECMCLMVCCSAPSLDHGCLGR